MSVQQQLGLEQDSLLVQQIREGWSTWCADDDRLAVVDEFDRFRYWLRTVGVDESDGALHALARLGARDGGDDVIAGAALAWALLPGAATLAARLTDISASIDELVAAQLWIEVRSFPWKRRRRVAANVLISTRAGVLHDLGVIAQVIRTDRVWANTGLLLDGDPEVAWSVSGGDCALRARVREQLSVDFYAEPTPAQEVEALLAWGVREALISDRDRLLLTELVGQAETTTRPVRGRAANGGLAGREVTRRVGSRLGVSPATVRRRVASSVTALVAASDRYVA